MHLLEVRSMQPYSKQLIGASVPCSAALWPATNKNSTEASKALVRVAATFSSARATAWELLRVGQELELVGQPCGRGQAGQDVGAGGGGKRADETGQDWVPVGLAAGAVVGCVAGMEARGAARGDERLGG